VSWSSSLWQKIKQHPYSTGFIVLLVVILFIFLAYRFSWDWTGFSSGTNRITITSTFKGNYTATISQPSKSLWDWLNLVGILAIPAVVGFGGVWYTAQQEKVSEKENTDNQRHAVLQAYIDKMSELLLNGHLAERTADGQLNPEHKQARDVGRLRTITVLAQLDARRVGYVFAFLREAELMSATKDDNAISLKNADLHAVNWSQADLRGADLRQTNLSGANLQRADLRQANLSGADLSGANLKDAIFFRTIYVPRAFGGTLVLSNSADLSGAILDDADLSGAKYTDEQLDKANSLKGARMHDGKIHD
jgi:uncharacterized protein YjbI with pentapeptide repeats